MKTIRAEQGVETEWDAGSGKERLVTIGAGRGTTIRRFVAYCADHETCCAADTRSHGDRAVRGRRSRTRSRRGRMGADDIAVAVGLFAAFMAMTVGSARYVSSGYAGAAHQVSIATRR